MKRNEVQISSFRKKLSPAEILSHNPLRADVSWLLAMTLLLTLPAAVQAQFIFVTNNGAITITQYTGSGAAVTIPSVINGLSVVMIAGGKGPFRDSSITSVAIPDSVTNIGYGAFSDCTKLTSVTIPDSVIYVGDYAFSECTSMTNIVVGNNVASVGSGVCWHCSNLTSITVPDSVLDIGNNAFAFCSSLTNAALGSNVLSLGPDAFHACSNLTEITVSESNTNFSSVGGVLFNKMQTAIVGCPPGKSGAYSIPQGVTNIGNYAFSTCAGLTGITIPDGVITIGTSAFSECTGLTNISIPNGVISFGDKAFDDCVGLTNITIPASVTNLGDWTFAGCSNLVGIYFQGNAPIAGVYVFSGDNNLIVYYLQVTLGWGSAFCGRPTMSLYPLVPYIAIVTNGAITILAYLGSNDVVSIPDTIDGLPVSAIGDSAFSGIGLTSVTIPDSVTNIGVGTFEWCVGLTNVTIGSGVVGIGDEAFVYCTNLTSVTIPDSVTSIGLGAFGACVGLTNVAIGSRVIGIGDYAFAYCTSLADVTIPASVASIGIYTFAVCPSLVAITVDELNPFYSDVDGVLFDRSTNSLVEFPGGKAGSYIVPDSVTNLAGGAFESCTNLTYVTIGSRVASVGPWTFNNCISLIAITVDASNSVFRSVDGVLFDKNQITLLRCPAGNLRDSYSIPSGVITIGTNAFSSCVGLTSIAIPDSVTNIGDSAFQNCSGLTSLAIPQSVINIGGWAFSDCLSLTNVVIGSGITSMGDGAYYFCTNLTRIFFNGNAPGLVGPSVFYGTPSTIYYLPGTTGWSATFGDCPTALWLPRIQTGDASFGVRTNQFGFNITWASDQQIVVEACTGLVSPLWQPLLSCTLTNGSVYFSDPDWTNYPARCYRVRSP